MTRFYCSNPIGMIKWVAEELQTSNDWIVLEVDMVLWRRLQRSNRVAMSFAWSGRICSQLLYIQGFCEQLVYYMNRTKSICDGFTVVIPKWWVNHHHVFFSDPIFSIYFRMTQQPSYDFHGSFGRSGVGPPGATQRRRLHVASGASGKGARGSHQARRKSWHHRTNLSG